MNNFQDDSRAAIRRLIGENAALDSNDIHALFARTFEDLMAAGHDHVAVADAGLYIACCHQQLILGSPAWVEALRGLCDLYERRLMNPQAKWRIN